MAKRVKITTPDIAGLAWSEDSTDRAIKWREHQPQLGPPYLRAMINKVCVATVRSKTTYISRTRSHEHAYSWRVHLPSLKEEFTTGSLPTREEAMQTAEVYIKAWFTAVRGK